MDSRLRDQLEHAKSLFYAWKLMEAHSILRRYFDRLPFQIEEGHAEYIGIFVRVLLELGRDYDLKFYLAELEKRGETSHKPSLVYQLAYVYAHLKEPRTETARELFEKLLCDPKAVEFHTKIKLALGNIYLAKGDFSSCKLLIESIKDPDDAYLVPLVQIWRAVIRRHEKRFKEAHEILAQVLEKTDPTENWYAYFSAWTARVKVLVEEGRTEEASDSLGLLEAELKGKRSRSLQSQLDHLAKMLRESAGYGTISLKHGEDGDPVLNYRSRSIVVDLSSIGGKVLLLFLKKRFLNRNAIVRLICGRPYEEGRDDQLVYTYVRYARHRLSALGLPSEAIARKQSGYRLMPDVEITRDS